MRRFFVSPHQVGRESIEIIGTEARHIGRVLRMQPGDPLVIVSGEDGREWDCVISSISKDAVVCDIQDLRQSAGESPLRISLYQCLPKLDKMELVIQKAVELGTDRIVPVEACRCQTRIGQDKAGAKQARWQAIAQAAAKQSGRSRLPVVEPPMAFAKAVEQCLSMDQAFIPYEDAKDMDYTKSCLENLDISKPLAIFIGPEGGFAREEVELAREAGIRPITLGRRILRTETAAMVLLSWLSYLYP